MAMNWAPITHKKQQPAQAYVRQFISIFMHIFLRFNNYIEFSNNVFTSFVICKIVSKLAVIYAPSLGCLWPKQLQSNVQKSVLQVQSCFLLISPIVSCFAVLVAFAV